MKAGGLVFQCTPKHVERSHTTPAYFSSRCNKNIKINANGRTVLAKVIDECDSVNGCDAENSFECDSLSPRLRRCGRRWRSPKPRLDIMMSLGL
ncbi:unnamed protein product, partial [Musa hybrid cultivar]